MVADPLRLEFSFVACYSFKDELIRCQLFPKLTKVLKSTPKIDNIRNLTYLIRIG